MGLSRRYESRFRFSAAVYIPATGVYLSTMSVGQTSVATATASTYPRTGIPVNGWAFSATYAGFDLIALNRSMGANGLPSNPTYPSTPTAPAWNNTTWGRVPNYIKVFNGVFIGDITTGSGYHEIDYVNGGVTYRYRIGIGFYHTVNLVNSCTSAITIEYRSFDRYSYPTGVAPIKMMTSWQTTAIPASGSVDISGYEPLEIRFSSNNMPSGVDVGITLQDETTKYLFLD